MNTPQKTPLLHFPINQLNHTDLLIYLYVKECVDAGTSERTRIEWQTRKVLGYFDPLQWIGHRLSLDYDTVNKSLRTICDLGWARPDPKFDGGLIIYGLLSNGKYGYYPEVLDDVQTTSDQIRKQTVRPSKPKPKKPNQPSKPKQKQVEILADCSDSLLSSLSQKDRTRLLNQHYKATYEQVFDEPAGFMKTAKESSLAHTIFQLNGESFQSTKDYMSFCLENWSDFKRTYNVRGLPTPSLLCQAWFYGYAKEAMSDGFKTKQRGGKDKDGIGDRASSAREQTNHGW